MSTARKYLACAEAGMTISETARHSCASRRPPWVKAAKAYGITFLRRMPKAPLSVSTRHSRAGNTRSPTWRLATGAASAHSAMRIAWPDGQTCAFADGIPGPQAGMGGA